MANESNSHSFFANIAKCYDWTKNALYPNFLKSTTEIMTEAKVKKREKMRKWCKRGSYINLPSALTGSYLQLRLPHERSLIAFSLMLLVVSFIRLIASLFLQMKEDTDSRDNQLSIGVNFMVMMLSMVTFCNGVIITAFREDGYDDAWLNVQEEVQYAFGFVLVTLISGEMSYYMFTDKTKMPTQEATEIANDEDDLETGASSTMSS